MARPAATSIATDRRRSSGPRLGELIEAFLDQLATGGGDVSERLLSAAAMPEPSSPSAWAERDVALVATLGLTGLGVSEVVSLSLGSLRRGPSGGPVLVTRASGQEQVVALQPGLADL